LGLVDFYLRGQLKIIEIAEKFGKKEAFFYVVAKCAHVVSAYVNGNHFPTVLKINLTCLLHALHQRYRLIQHVAI
jgi:hypothetical protein